MGKDHHRFVIYPVATCRVVRQPKINYYWILLYNANRLLFIAIEQNAFSNYMLASMQFNGSSKFESSGAQTRRYVTFICSPIIGFFPKGNLHYHPLSKEIMRNPIFSPLNISAKRCEMYRFPVYCNVVNEPVVRMKIMSYYPWICYCPLDLWKRGRQNQIDWLSCNWDETGHHPD